MAARVPNKGSPSGRGCKDAEMRRRHGRDSAYVCEGGGTRGLVHGRGVGAKEGFHLKRWGAEQGGAEIKKGKSRLSDNQLFDSFKFRS